MYCYYNILYNKMAASLVSESDSSSALPSSAACAVCRRTISVTAAGVVRVHGPVTLRCPGSRRLPTTTEALASSSVSRGLQHDEPVTHPSQPLLDASFPLPPRCEFRVIKRIPRASRALAGSKLASILDAVTRENDHASWNRLLRFCSRCFKVPSRGGHRRSLVAAIARQLDEETDDPSATPVISRGRRTRRPPQDPTKVWASRVSMKLEEGDFRGAVRLACSEDTIAASNDATFAALQLKHPPPHPDSSIPPLPQDTVAPSLSVSTDEVAKAIRSFPVGSAGGPDGLRPQHLKDLIGPSSEGGGHVLLSALASFLSLVLSGRTPLSIRPYFFGANLFALEKKDGGVRPIAVGCTLRRLAAKVASGKVLEDMAALLAPRQLGFGVKGGVEAAVHCARLYLRNLKPQQVLLKLDFKNAFNSLRRDKMLSAVQVLAPTILPFVHSAYSSTSFLFWDDKSIQSCEGIQQGDPLGTLLFCLTLYQLQSRLESEFCLLYLDDVTLGGDQEEILHDFKIFEQEAADLGLRLNQLKSEVISEAWATEKYVLSFIPGASVVASSDACLLGSPIGDIESVSSSIAEKIRLWGSWEIDFNTLTPISPFSYFAILLPSLSSCTLFELLLVFFLLTWHCMTID